VAEYFYHVITVTVAVTCVNEVSVPYSSVSVKKTRKYGGHGIETTIIVYFVPAESPRISACTAEPPEGTG
jgi:cbb3-type cytochrome oxidase subunit 1